MLLKKLSVTALLPMLYILRFRKSFRSDNHQSGSQTENCLDPIFAAPPCEKVIIVPDTNYIISAIRKFMLDMPSPGSSQNIGVLI